MVFHQILDMARFKAALAFFPAVFRSGGTMALGGNILPYRQL
jgi:hypothetical protein